MRPFLTRLLFCLATLSTCSLQARTWTSKAGTTLEAELLSHEGEEVELRLSTGKVLKVNFAQLSEKDQDYVTEATQEKRAKTGGRKTDRQKKENPSYENWDAPWPQNVRIKINDFEVTIALEDERERQYIYHSDHFEFVCDVKLAKSLVRKLAWYFEASHAYVAALPLSMARTQENKRHQILLFESKSTYHQNGGPANSGGVYLGGKDLIMVPLVNVGVRKAGSSYRIDFDTSNRILSHEIVHQLTDKAYFKKGARGWFSEGLAEYVALTPYRSGIYNLNRNTKEIVEYITDFGSFNRGYNLGEEISVGPLEAFMDMPYASFLSNSFHNYGVSCLIVTYFMDLGGEAQRTNLQNYLKALKSLKRGDDPVQAREALLNGRSYQDLAADISKKWRPRGVTLNFY